MTSAPTSGARPVRRSRSRRAELVPSAALEALSDRQRFVLRVLYDDARPTYVRTSLAAKSQGHARAGVRLEEIADAVGLGVPRVRVIRLHHRAYDRAADRGVAPQVREWGWVATAAAAAGATVSALASVSPRRPPPG